LLWESRKGKKEKRKDGGSRSWWPLNAFFPIEVLIRPLWKTLYFKNKEELYASLSLRILQYLLIRVEHVNEEKDSGPEEKLKSLVDAMYDVYEFDPLIIINMFHLQSSETLKNLSPQLMSEITGLFYG
jgi:hypothetical protein